MIESVKTPLIWDQLISKSSLNNPLYICIGIYVCAFVVIDWYAKKCICRERETRLMEIEISDSRKVGLGFIEHRCGLTAIILQRRCTSRLLAKGMYF